VITEITDSKNARGWVLFDAQCLLCMRLARHWGPLLGRHRFALVPLQTPWVREFLAKGDGELLSEMRLITSEGDVYGGADALIALARQIWWAWPVYLLARLPTVRPALHKAYAWAARRRHCLGRGCQIGERSGSLGLCVLNWGPAVALPMLAAILGQHLAGWVWMWVMALALFIGAKWITISRLLLSKGRVNRLRLLEYSLFWPGMDSWAFCVGSSVPVPPIREWLVAAAKTLFGAALVWVGVHWIGSSHPLVTGWVGMIGFVFLLHFGAFHLLSLLWRAFGINAKPIMQSPGSATSLSKFWGGNWNAAFSDLMQEHFFKPMARHLGARRALFAIFLISGVLHELVISLPAHGGYGLPTLYFAIQGLALLFERSEFGREMGLGSGWKGWCFVALVSGAPAFWLFHPTFIYNVILPMLHAVGAT